MGMTLFKIKWHLGAVLKTAVYKIAFGKNFSVGKDTTFRSRFNVYLEKGAKISIGEKCFFNNDCSINSLDSIVIGNGNIFGENVKLYDHNHRYQDHNVSLKEQGFVTKPIVIGNDCWFGSNVTVLQGVHIGNNCVIGANSLIYKDIEDGSIVTSDSKIAVRKKS